MIAQEYDKALATYRTGLEKEPENEELMEGAQRCIDAIGRCGVLRPGQRAVQCAGLTAAAVSALRGTRRACGS